MRYLEALQAKEYFGTMAGQRGQTLSGITGTMAAALAANATVVAWRYPAAGFGYGLVKWVHLHYTCLLGFTAPVTAGRRLVFKRATMVGSVDPTGGTNLDVCMDSPVSTEMSWGGQIATTTGLGGSFVYESAPRRRLLLAGVGVSGYDYDELWTMDDPVLLLAGQACGVTAGQAFDAVGTWQLNATIGVVEVL